jgi:hypothetical protein
MSVRIERTGAARLKRGLGWTLAAGSAWLLATMIAREAAPVDAALFAVSATLITGASVVSGTSVFHPCRP